MGVIQRQRPMRAETVRKRKVERLLYLFCIDGLRSKVSFVIVPNAVLRNCISHVRIIVVNGKRCVLAECVTNTHRPYIALFIFERTRTKIVRIVVHLDGTVYPAVAEICTRRLVKSILRIQ